MARIELLIPNPVSTTDSALYTKIKLQISAAQTGPWANVATVDIDTRDEQTVVVDIGGSFVAWYRYAYTNAEIPPDVSDYRVPIQAGDYVARQWAKADIPDDDILDADWNRWRDQVLQDMANEGLGKPADIQSVTCSSNTDEWHDLNYGIRRVTGVEVYDSGGNYVAPLRNFQQRGRQVRFFRPRTGITYKVYGAGEINSLVDLDDEMFTCLKWGMRMYYIDRRRTERLNMRVSLARTRQSDTPTMDVLTHLYQEAKAEFVSRMQKGNYQGAMSYGRTV